MGFPRGARAQCELEVVWVGVDETVDEVDLLQRVMYVLGVDVIAEVAGGAGAAGEDAPERATDTALVQAWDVDVLADGLAEGEVGAVDVVAVGVPDVDGEIVVAVDQGSGFQDVLHSLVN